MTTLLVFAICLTIASLLSGLARRTVLSTAVIFLAAGIVLGATGVLRVAPHVPAVGQIAEIALFTILYTDGMRLPVGELVEGWRLPARALGIGLPLTLLVTALAGVVLAGLGWVDALLLGAVLSPTDPVFAAALIGRDDVPGRLRHLRSVESGLNDGLALPFVVILLAVMQGHGAPVMTTVLDLIGGVALGVGVPFVVTAATRLPGFGASERYRPVAAIAIGLLVFGLADVTGANPYLAAFAAGVTLATLRREGLEAFETTGDTLAEVAKLAAVLEFGALFVHLVGVPGWRTIAFVVVALLVARPLALVIALAGTHLERRELVASAWFGPKGFATVVYALLVADTGGPHATRILELAGLVVATSITAHSSTDIVVARWFALTPDDIADRAELERSPGW